MEAKKKIAACYDRGAYAAFVKFALAPTTPADSFIANVDQGKDMPLDPTTDANPAMGVSESADAMPFPEDPAMAQGEIPAGMAAKSAALKKFAVSAGMYARAAQGAAARRGASMPASLMSDVSSGQMVRRGLQAGQPRAGFSPDVGPVARQPGAMMPTEEQRKMRGFLSQLHPGSTEHPATPQQELRNRALMELSGHQYPAASGLESNLKSMPSGRVQHETMGMRKSPSPAMFSGMGLGLPPIPPGAAKSRSFEAFKPTSEIGMPTGQWAGPEATMPEHLNSIPGMPAYHP